jgi:hypothetical protein
MKLEGWEKIAVCQAPKLYRIGKVYRAKGVPKRLAKDFFERGRVDYDIPFRFREAVAFYDRSNSKKLSVWRNVEKFRRGGYDRKKQVGNRFIPCKVWHD